MFDAVSGAAQTDSIVYRNEARIFGAYGYQSVATDLPLPRDSETGESCGIFRDGSGDGLSLSFGIDHDIFEAGGLGLTAGIFTWDVTTSFPCHEEAEIRLPDGSLVPAVTEFVRESTGVGVNVGLAVYMRPLRSVRVALGVVYLQPLTSEVNHGEEVRSPDGATFLDGRGSRAVPGVEEGRQLQLFSGVIGAEYRLTAGERFYLTPGIRLTMPLIHAEDHGPDLLSVQFGLGAAYRFNFIPPAMSTPLEPARQ